MLSIMDPVELENLVLFRDDEDPRKFYLLPDEPVIPLDEEGLPDFYFIKYIRDQATLPDGKAAGGGWLRFRTVLTIAPERRQRVIDGLRAQLVQDQQAGRKPFGVPITSTEPVLAAPLWTAGTVHMETLKVGDNEMVRKATETAPVDLAGALGASLAVELDPDGCEIFWSAFQRFAEQQVPIIIDYNLTYKARVSARMTIHAERSTVEKQVWERAQPKPYFWQKNIARWAPIVFAGKLQPHHIGELQALRPERVAALVDPGKVTEAIHSCVTDGTITVRIDTDDAGAARPGSGGTVQEMLFKLVTDVLSGRIIPALFGEASTPQPVAASDKDTAIVAQLHEMKIDTSASTTTTFDIDLDSRSTIERNCNPNASVHLLLATPQAMASRFRELRLADGFFAVMRLAIATSGINFERDGINMVHVHIRYDQVDELHPERARVLREYDDALRSASDTLHRSFDMARDAQGGHKREYQFRTDVYYGDVTIKTDWAPCSDAMLLINPAAMGAVRVELTLTAPKEQVKSARVNLRYRKGDGTDLTDSFLLTADAPRKTWFKATGEVGRPGAAARARPYSYQVLYQVGGDDITTPWADATSENLEIPGPFVKVVTFNFRPQGSFDGVAGISVDATYEDAAHGYRFVKSFLLDKLSASMPVDVPVMDGGPEEIRWTARINRTNGTAAPLPDGRAPVGTVWVGDAVADFLNVQVMADLIDFDHDVQLAVVSLRYHAEGHDEQKTMTFSKAARGPQTWQVALRAGASRKYDADVRYIAYDRPKSSNPHFTDIEDAVLLLDRTAG